MATSTHTVLTTAATRSVFEENMKWLVPVLVVLGIALILSSVCFVYLMIRRRKQLKVARNEFAPKSSDAISPKLLADGKSEKRSGDGGSEESSVIVPSDKEREEFQEELLTRHSTPLTTKKLTKSSTPISETKLPETSKTAPSVTMVKRSCSVARETKHSLSLHGDERKPFIAQVLQKSLLAKISSKTPEKKPKHFPKPKSILVPQSSVRDAKIIPISKTVSSSKTACTSKTGAKR